MPVVSLLPPDRPPPGPAGVGLLRSRGLHDPQATSLSTEPPEIWSSSGRRPWAVHGVTQLRDRSPGCSHNQQSTPERYPPPRRHRRSGIRPAVFSRHHAAAHRLEVQGKLRGRRVACDVAGGLVISQRIPIFVSDMLDEDRCHFHFQGLRTAIGLLASAAG
jgi:hypothetical protein